MAFVYGACNLTWGIQIEILVIRVEKSIAGRESSKYLKVVYEHLHGQPNLPKEIYDGRSSWRFALTKASTDDDSCSGPLTQITRTVGAQEEPLPNDVSIPCYVLQPGHVKRVSH